MKVVIDVTKQDIADAEAWRDAPHREFSSWGNMCPVGRAATRAFSKPMTAGYTKLFEEVFPGFVGDFGTLPEEAQDLIVRFDRYLSIYPISFEIEIGR